MGLDLSVPLNPVIQRGPTLFHGQTIFISSSSLHIHMARECEKIKNVCYKLQQNSEPSEVVVKFVSGKMEGVWTNV